MIRFEDVSFGYTGERAINHVSFSLEKGSFTAVIGANGAGKSTISKLMRGLVKPSEGRIVFDGTDLMSMQASALASRMGFLFQNPDRQICKETVREELMFSLEHTVSDESLKAQYCEEVMNALDLRGEDDPFLLSRGERQRVALASALVHRPELLILDEPTTGLDYKECTQIMEYVRKRNDEGVTVVMVCHDMEVVLDYARQVIVMADGAMLGMGETRAVFTDETLLKSASLLPPQIVGLSELLPPEFHGISTVEDMADAIGRRVQV